MKAEYNDYAFPFLIQVTINDDTNSIAIQAVVTIVPVVVDNPPQFGDQPTFNVSEDSADGVIVGTILVTDDMGK